MPRTARATIAGHCYHVINRGNNRAERFHGGSDYQHFVRLMSEACDRIALPLLGACLMPNHVHLVVQPASDSDLARWIHWLFLTYSRRYHHKYGTSGRVWENRYKAFAIQGDLHLLTVLRYVERNALRANLVAHAEDWPWGSLSWRTRPKSPLRLSDSPVGIPKDWVQRVNAPHTADELAAIRTSVNRQRPFGDTTWAEQTAADLGLAHTLRPRGRPKILAAEK